MDKARGRVPQVREANLGFHAYDAMTNGYDGLRSMFIIVASREGCKSTGKERDTETGLDYFKYSYYASNMGRWMSPDPSGLRYADLANPQSLNLYSYVGNSPLTRADLDGLCWKGFQ